jgi:hypothetical protein
MLVLFETGGLDLAGGGGGMDLCSLLHRSLADFFTYSRCGEMRWSGGKMMAAEAVRQGAIERPKIDSAGDSKGRPKSSQPAAAFLARTVAL